MKAVAIVIGWFAAGTAMVYVAGDTGRRVAEIDADFPRMVLEARK